MAWFLSIDDELSDKVEFQVSIHFNLAPEMDLISEKPQCSPKESLLLVYIQVFSADNDRFPEMLTFFRLVSSSVRMNPM